MSSWEVTPRRPFGQNSLVSPTFKEIQQEKECDLEREGTFRTAVIGGDKDVVKMHWQQLCDYRWRHDLHALLDRVKPNLQTIYLQNEYKQWLAKWITKTESKLEEHDAFASKYQKIKRDLLSAACGLQLDDLWAVAEQLQEIYANQPALSPSFFQREWEQARGIVQDTHDSEKKEEILAFIHDAIKRIESKQALHLVIDRCNSWNLKELSKKIEAIYADRAALFPRSLRTIESDWAAARECIDSNLNAEKRKEALSIISNAEERLPWGWEHKLY